jgi:nitrous oxide reductase accessory protein NosL
VTYQASPRQTAGGPLAEDILKCELKPLAFSDADYTGITFTADQQARLRAVFATGVCDWSKPGVGQQRSPGWYTFATGTGVALPAAPVATPQ